jgi:hypothetical protein
VRSIAAGSERAPNDGISRIAADETGMTVCDELHPTCLTVNHISPYTRNRIAHPKAVTTVQFNASGVRSVQPYMRAWIFSEPRAPFSCRKQMTTHLNCVSSCASALQNVSLHQCPLVDHKNYILQHTTRTSSYPFAYAWF